ncbi:M48 family metalloprotease [Nitrincola sp. MINF-07-Sa-05]|uniref:M48 family metalloprotease n=1 Tax=Nitrincola salilacus TaxID=3400273 RepID=UPI003917E19F
MIRFFLLLILTFGFQTTYADTRLPSLTGPGVAMVAADAEYRLGRNWARILRGRAPLLEDPITYHYLDDLLWRLVPSSQITDRRLELIMLDNPSFNAFAVPGGIIGVHGGLFLAAESEDELASVLAHELAHLSQRHFAQRMEEERRARPLVLAGILASILISAADVQGGTAALSTTIAAQAQSQLSFSRRYEQEADRIGMQTLAASGLDPHAMPQMFSRLQRNYRFYGQRPPEFLLTHPVTESRIADSLNRAETLPKPAESAYNPEYEIVKTRLEVHFSNQPAQTLQRYQADNLANPSAKNDYGIVMAAMRNGQISLAREHLKKLPAAWRQHLYIALSEVEIMLSAGEYAEAFERSSTLNKIYPDNLPVRKLLATAARETGKLQQATTIYRQILRDYPTDTDSLFQLAETEGLLGNILAVHEARIDYFLLTGNFDHAQRQVEFAKRDSSQSPADISRFEEKAAEVEEIRKQVREDL